MTAISMTQRYDNNVIHKTVHENYTTDTNIELERSDYYVVVLERGAVPT